MPWIRRTLRGNDVFVRCGDDGTPDVGPDGRVDIAYKLAASAPLYRAAPRNLEPTGRAADEVPREGEGGEPERRAEPAAKSATTQASAGKRGSTTSARPPRAAADTIVIYTDGACTGNPGPAGLGAVVIDRGRRSELSEYLGSATNNIAELSAIQRALEAIAPADRGRTVHLHTDSSYSIGVLTKGWKAKANQALIADIRALVGTFPKLVLVKVKGHAGIPENERADELARQAVAENR